MLNNVEPVAKVGYFCTGLQPLVACSFSPYGLQNCGSQAVAVAKLKAHPVLPGAIATASIIGKSIDIPQNISPYWKNGVSLKPPLYPKGTHGNGKL
ncbi:MAG: hypothetical protein LBG84_01760, partial [Treponema sp.]|nr:hypothetical protein [Treponema sp.]